MNKLPNKYQEKQDNCKNEYTIQFLYKMTPFDTYFKFFSD